jgi:2-amino-4-hydroxy-6-hydroxymethyldihydropteridine diphosphokinase
LLKDLKAMERRYGRDAAPIRNSPRELDLDLLLFGDDERRSELLTLPHPRADRRRFVMVPAAEVAPGWVWPGTGRSISEIAESLVTGERLARI